MNTIDQLLTNVYELEGLLLVMQRHKDDIPQLVIDNFKEKAQQIAAAASVVATPAHCEPPIFAPSAPASTDPESSVTPPAFHVQEPVVEPEPVVVIEPVPDNAPHPESVSEPKPVMTREEPFAPQEPPTRDITSSFSINDRFLFQRELFNGDKQKYSDAIAEMQRLADIDKIKDFINDVLGLDRSNEVVKEFVRLIESSFK